MWDDNLYYKLYALLCLIRSPRTHDTSSYFVEASIYAFQISPQIGIEHGLGRTFLNNLDEFCSNNPHDYNKDQLKIIFV